METKLSYLCICPWANLPDFLYFCKEFVPNSIYPSRDGKSALVEFTPNPCECVELHNLIQSYGKKDN